MVAIDGAGFDWIFMADEEVPTNMALMAFSDSEVYNDKTCTNTCLKSFKTLKTQYDNLRVEFNKSKFNLATYKRGLAFVEEQLVFYKKNEVMFCDQIAVLKRDTSFKDSEINALKSEIEKLKKKKESNQIKIDKFENASKSLDKLIGSQISDNSRKGVGFVSYNAVPPPPTGLFAPPTIDLSNSGLEEFQQPEFEGYGPKASKSVCKDTSNEVKKTPDAPLGEKLVSEKEKQIAHCNYHQREGMVNGNNFTRVNYNYSAKKAYPNSHKNMTPKAVLMKTGLKPLNTARPVNIEKVYTAKPKAVNTARPTSAVVNAVKANQTSKNLMGDMLPLEEEQGEEELLVKELLKQKICSSYMRVPFGCHVTILHTLDHLGKFDRKSDDGFFVGYSLTSNAFKVYNIRTRKVEENLHIRFLENKPIVTGDGPKWLFDIDSLTKSMNYVPAVADDSMFDSSSKNSNDDEPQPSSNAEKKDDEGVSKASVFSDQEQPKSSTLNINIVGPSINTTSAKFKTGSLNINIVSPTVITTRSNCSQNVFDIFSLGGSATLEATHADLFGNETETDMSNLTTSYQVPTTPNTRIHKDHSLDHVIGDIEFGVQIRGMTKNTNEHGFISAVYEEKIHKDLHTCLFACFLSQKEQKRIAKALSDLAWEEAMQEELLQFKLQKVWILVDLPKKEGIDYDKVFAPVARIDAIRLFLAYASFMGFKVYQMDVKSAFLYVTIEEEVYVCQPLGFEDPDYPDKVYKVVKALYGLHQALRAWYGTLAKYLLDNGFQRGKIDQTLFIKKKKGYILLVQVYVDDIIFVSTNKELCTEFEKLMHDKFQMSSIGELNFYLEKPLLKDSDGDDVDVHLYRSMIGSLMYLTSSRPDIMFAVYACARFQVTPKVLHSHAVKRIFRSKNCVATSILKAEYVAATSCCGQVEDMGITATIDGKVKVVFEASIRRHLKLEDSDGISTLSTIEIFEQLALISNMKRASKGYTGVDTPLFQTMLVQGQTLQGEGSTIPVESHHTPTSAPSTSQPPTSSPSMPTTHVGEEAAPMPHDSPLPRVHSLGSDKGSLTLNELTVLCTSLSKKVESLESDLKQTKQTYGAAYTKLIMKVKKLEHKVKSIKARRKVRFVISDDEDDLEDPSKQGRKIAQIDEDKGITLVQMGAQTQGRSDKDLMYETGVYDYPEGFTGPSISITTAEPATTAGEEVSTAEPDMDVTLVEALVDLLKSGKKKSPNPKARGISFQDPEEVARREVISPPVSKISAKDKGKAIMTEPEKPLKKKDQIQSDEELALRLHAKEQAEFKRLQKERAAQEKLAE
ncbi:putative ribonuclease H-like domain-containing protein [Tanacetum coccineum]